MKIVDSNGREIRPGSYLRHTVSGNDDVRKVIEIVPAKGENVAQVLLEDGAIVGGEWKYFRRSYYTISADRFPKLPLVVVPELEPERDETATPAAPPIDAAAALDRFSRGGGDR